MCAPRLYCWVDAPSSAALPPLHRVVPSAPAADGCRQGKRGAWRVAGPAQLCMPWCAVLQHAPACERFAAASPRTHSCPRAPPPNHWLRQAGRLRLRSQGQERCRDPALLPILHGEAATRWHCSASSPLDPLFAALLGLRVGWATTAALDQSQLCLQSLKLSASPRPHRRSCTATSAGAPTSRRATLAAAPRKSDSCVSPSWQHNIVQPASRMA